MRIVCTLSLALALVGCEKGNAKSGPSQAAKKSTETAKATAGKKKGALLNPGKAKEKAPAKYAVKLETTKGDIIIDVTRAWSPNGADRFYNLVKVGYYDDVSFFRVIAGFMGQVGISGDPKANAAWRPARIKDDPRNKSVSNKPGFVTFAKTGAPNSRTTQFFVNLGNNGRLDGMGFTPFGKLRSMSVMEKIYSGYGEGAPRGRGPAQGRLQSEGNAYLRKNFPELDYIKRATITK